MLPHHTDVLWRDIKDRVNALLKIIFRSGFMRSCK